MGSLGDEAAQVARALPVGRGYVCEDADDIPKTFAHIFRRASTLDLLWLLVVLALSRYFLPYGCTSHLAQARQDRRRRELLTWNQRHQQQYGVRCIGTVCSRLYGPRGAAFLSLSPFCPHGFYLQPYGLSSGWGAYMLQRSSMCRYFSAGGVLAVLPAGFSASPSASSGPVWAHSVIVWATLRK